MKKIASILALMLAVTFTCSAQSEEEESQLFGYTRSLAECKILSIGEIGTEVISKQIVVRNDTPKTMQFVGFVLPDGFSAIAKSKTVEDFSSGIVEISIDPALAKEIDGQVIMVNVMYIDRQGKEEIVQLPYKLQAD